MPRPVYIPDAPEIAVVETAADLFGHKRADRESMVLLPRPISGRFNDLAIWLLRRNEWHDTLIHERQQYIPVRYTVKDLEAMKTSAGMDWPAELALICDDMHRMEQAKRVTSELRVVRDHGYEPDTYEFHQDGPDNIVTPLTHEIGRVMCCYNGPVTECLLSADAVPLTGDAHFVKLFSARDGAKPYQPGIGDMWRQVSRGQGPYPLVHRAIEVGQGKRLFPWIGPRPWNPPRLVVVC